MITIIKNDVNLQKEVLMDRQKLKKLGALTFDLNMDLSILNSAVKNIDDDLEVCSLVNFIERIYKTSNDIMDIFYNL